MTTESVNEIFGRWIPFRDITPIRKVLQPGILSNDTFFNPSALSVALKELSYFNEDVSVYFNDISGGMGVRNPSKNRKWWEGIQELGKRLEGFPAGFEMKWFYGEGTEKNPHYHSPEFDESKKPYQANLELFGDSIQAFSCFVYGNKEGVTIRSNRNNYDRLANGRGEPGEGLVHDMKGLWIGERDLLFSSACRLSQAIVDMNRDYSMGVSGHNFDNPEIRIISSKGRGALVSRLVEGSSVTLFVGPAEMSSVVEKYNARMSRILSVVA